MSSRHLRKLQQQRELEQAKQANFKAETDVQEESDDEPVDLHVSKPKPSLFASFAALDDEGDEDDSEKEKEIEENSELDLPEQTPTTIQKKPKKSKKKKKAKNKARDGDTPEKDQNIQEGLDEIDAALAALKIKNERAGVSTNDPTPAIDPHFEKVCSLLGVNTIHLKVANEMKNLFGKAAVEVHDDPAARDSRRRQRQPQQVDLETALKGRHLPGKGLPELTLRRNIFIQGKEDWPRASTGGLSLAVVENSTNASQRGNGVVEFKFVHDQSYQSVQQQFDLCVEMGEPQNLIGLLQRNPYHISTLIQVSKVAKNQTDHSLASDLLERALFTFARSSTSLFATKMSQGKAFIDFKRPENRELWLAGYQYIKSLVMKGTYRTAFEWAKLLYSLDPKNDPYQMMLMMHNLALRAHENQWLLDTSDMFEHPASASHITPSYALAAMQIKDGAKCRDLLEDSMKKLPWLFVQLFREINLDAPSSVWGATPRTDAETLFSEIYVRQTKDLWNTPEATSLLMEIAHAIDKVDISQTPLTQNDAISLDVVRFVYLDNTPALMGMVPSALLHRSNNSDSDPLPPDHSTYSYESQKNRLEPHGGSQGSGGLQGDHFDPIAALARLLPRFNGPAEGQEELRRELEEAIALEEGEELDTDGDDESRSGPRPSNNMGRRILNMIWGSGRIDEAADSSSDHTDTESDEDLPEPEQRHEHD